MAVFIPTYSKINACRKSEPLNIVFLDENYKKKWLRMSLLFGLNKSLVSVIKNYEISLYEYMTIERIQYQFLIYNPKLILYKIIKKCTD